MKLTQQLFAPRSLVALAAALGLAACAGVESGKTPANAASVTARDSAGAMSRMEGMQGMPGMKDSMSGSGMMEQMQTHMREMDGVSADSMKAMLPTHQRMVTSMMSQFNKEMGDMNMPGNAAWTATVDSVRRDLTRMPAMSASELQQFKPAHHARVMRVMEMHKTMMRGMKM